MNSSLVIKSLLIFCAFSGLGLILALMVNDFDNNKPTEESYLKSDYYAKTKKSYEDAMLYYDSNNNTARSFSTLLSIISIPLAISYYVLNREKSKENKL